MPELLDADELGSSWPGHSLQPRASDKGGPRPRDITRTDRRFAAPPRAASLAAIPGALWAIGYEAKPCDNACINVAFASNHRAHTKTPVSIPENEESSVQSSHRRGLWSLVER